MPFFHPSQLTHSSHKMNSISLLDFPLFNSVLYFCVLFLFFAIPTALGGSWDRDQIQGAVAACAIQEPTVPYRNFK